MKTSALILSMMVFAGLAIGLTSLYDDIQYSYSPTNSSSTSGLRGFNSTFGTVRDQMNSLQNHSIGFGTKSITDHTKYTDAVLAFVDLAGILAETPNTFIKMVSTSVGAMTGIYVPEWFITLIIISVVIVVAMNIANIFIKAE